MSRKMNWERPRRSAERYYSARYYGVTADDALRVAMQITRETMIARAIARPRRPSRFAPVGPTHRRAWIASLTGAAKHRHFSQNIKPGQRSLTRDEIYEIYGVK